MDKQIDFTASKLKLIYEFNNSSPIFARVASVISEEGNLWEAIEILEKGLALYPDYPTAYFVKAIALAYCGKEAEAQEAAQRGADLIDSTSTLESYLNIINKIITNRNSIKETKRRTFLQDAQQSTEIEDQLDLLAKKLTGAKIKYNPDEASDAVPEAPRYTGKKIASETLAGIYTAQKNYKSAINIYRELIRNNPSKTDYYASRITELQNMIDEESGIQLSDS